MPHPHIKNLILFTLLCLLPIPALAATHSPPAVVHVGVLAFDGEARARDRWGALARYLDGGIAGYRFEIEPLTHEEFRNRIRKGQLDFILTNPAHYVRLEQAFGATRIATFRSRHGNASLTRFGSVIFSRSDSPIKHLQDLAGKRLAAVNQEAFGGFLLARKRLLDIDIDALTELRPQWLGFPQREIVQAVLKGRADAGTVRTGVLEQMIDNNELAPGQLHILGQRRVEGFPLLLSTALYPEWAFARLPHTEQELARQVTLRLLQMPPDSAVARATGGAGWTIPLDYSHVRDVLRELQIEPFVPRPPSLGDLWQSHGGLILGLIGALALGALGLVYILRINRELQHSQRALIRHRDELEQLVEERTSALISANDELRRDIESRSHYEETLQSGCECLQSIHALIMRDDLSREQRLQSVLDQLRQYYGAEQILLSRVENQVPLHCTASPALNAATAPLQPTLAGQAIESKTRIEDRITATDGGPRYYLASPVVRQGRVTCLIELIAASTTNETNRLLEGDKLGRRILQLVSHWLAHENDAQTREAEREKAAQRLSGLTPREHEVLVEVAEGAPNKLIARHLGISIKTVELHRSNLMQKLEISNAAELTRLAMSAGLVVSDSSISQ